MFFPRLRDLENENMKRKLQNVSIPNGLIHKIKQSQKSNSTLNWNSFYSGSGKHEYIRVDTGMAI